MTNVASVDRSTLYDLAELTGESDPLFVARLVDLFVKNAPARILKLNESFARKDGKGIAFEAHTLKSSSANLGAIPLSELARSLEAFGIAGTFSDEVKATLQKLEGEYAAVVTALHQFVEEQQTPKKAA